MPAFIKIRTGEEKWEIGITPDYSEILKEPWWLIYKQKMKKPLSVDEDDLSACEEDFDEDKQRDYISWGDALSDEHIDWFRK